MADAARLGEEAQKDLVRYEQAVGTNERTQTLRIGALEEARTSTFQDVMILDRKISAVENELRQARR